MSGPLFGKRVVNTRATHQAGELNRLLSERGALPVAYPCIAIAPPLDPAPLDSAVERLAAGWYDWLVLTSANAALALAAAVTAHGFDPDAAPPARIAAIGPATALALHERLGWEPEVLASVATGDRLGAELPVTVGATVFLPASTIARAELPLTLTDRGAEVDVVVSYRTVPGVGGADLPSQLAHGQVDAITFASPSAVDGFFARHRAEAGSAPLLHGIPVACIGPTTLQTAIERGCPLTITSHDQSLPGLLDALATALTELDPVPGGSPWHSI